ncbi:uncharacterized protein LOC114290615 isoform X2 [Camellia sinensis]|uniref:uncharacterized protein LOC114290615 isoform X2 n=1 Tax=Camellia sinensis TaxID=4442 RepID=UPI001035EC01|nr:uncharacterized protein LOC114290615 isoform X2 [Camellia sinensis]
MQREVIPSCFLYCWIQRILPTWKMNNTRQNRQSFECNKLVQISLGEEMNHTRQDTQSNKCKNQCRPVGSEAFPEILTWKCALYGVLLQKMYVKQQLDISMNVRMKA